MTNNTDIALNLLKFFNFAILRRTAPRTYTFLGQAPDFYDVLFPPVNGVPCATPWAISPMLDFFIGEAEEFFERNETGMITSGPWEEDGITEDGTALFAMAAHTEGEKLFIVHQLREEYSERLAILRKARVQFVENRELASSLSFFKEKSRIDGLTSIFNRDTFTELLHDEIRRSQILDYPLVLLILDIDNFKKVNDTYGHMAGDKVLQGIGSTLKTSLRRNDIVARYGGEEFAVIISHESLDQAVAIADKIRLNIAAMVIPEAPQVTVSVGCALHIKSESSETFFKRADSALYVAKATGKNKVCVGES